MIPLHDPQHAQRPTAIALGSFDGLHQGHRRVIAAITAGRAEFEPGESDPDKADPRKADPRKAVPTVVSFWPHPREVLHGETRLRLDLPAEKLELLEPLGVRQLVLVPFDAELAALSPEAFVTQVLAGSLQARQVAVGDNFRFGAGRRGDVGDLARLGARHGIAVTVVPMLHVDGERVSSSRIRRALAAGAIEEARRLLQRPYRFSGRVVQGRGLGRGLGWPTANLRIDGRKFLPQEGVYACWAWIQAGAATPQGAEARQPSATTTNQACPPEEPPLSQQQRPTEQNSTERSEQTERRSDPACMTAPACSSAPATLAGVALPAVMNLGPQPTVDPDSPSAVEVHLLETGVSGELDLSGAWLTVEPVERLRGQIRFSGLEELSARIGADAAEARALLARQGPAGPAPAIADALPSFRSWGRRG